MFIFKRVPTENKKQKDKFVQHKRFNLRKIPIFSDPEDKVCMSFHFKQSDSNETDTLIFCKKNLLFEMNFEKEPEQQITIIYNFKTIFKRLPLFFQPNKNQKIFMISSPEDGMYLDL